MIEKVELSLIFVLSSDNKDDMAGMEMGLKQDRRRAELLWPCSAFVTPEGY